MIADEGVSESVKFLRLNCINKCNCEMGGVDMADQLRGMCRLDENARNRKWWWSVLFWRMEVLLTDSHKLCLNVALERRCANTGLIQS